MAEVGLGNDMKYRDHRGELAESMATVVELPPTMNALAEHLKCDPSDLAVQPYGYDERIGWNTYLVTKQGCGLGMTDGPVRAADESLEIDTDGVQALVGRTIVSVHREPPSSNRCPMDDETLTITLDDDSVWTFDGWGYDACGLTITMERKTEEAAKPNCEPPLTLPPR